MRVAIIRHSIRNRGADYLLFDYASFLVQHGHHVDYWTNEVNTRFAYDPRINICPIPYKGVLGTMWFTLTTIFTADIVLVDLVVMACLAWVRNGQKVICLAQDYDVSYYHSLVLRALTVMAYKIALQLMRIPFICVSLNLGEEIARHGSPQLIKAVPNGIDLDKFYKNPQSRFLVSRKAAVVVALYIRDDYRKGVDIAIKALQRLAQQGHQSGWELWLFGQDQDIALNIEGVRVSKFGLLSEEDLRDFLSAVDIYFSASRHEGFSLLSFQAMACGCSLAVSQAFANVKDGIHGLVSPVNDDQAAADNLGKLIDNKTLRQYYGNNGLSFVRGFDIKESRKNFMRSLGKG